MVVLGAGAAAVAVATIVGLHLHLFTPLPKTPRSPVLPTATPSPPVLRPGSGHGTSFHLPLAALLYTLLVVVLLAGLVLSVWWARRLRPSIGAREDGFIAHDSEDLREAVESGRSALRTVDDARAAIIACYVAMENSLAERGAARGIADTPDELLARARQSGIVRGTAAARLTALFYEARFSSHPLDQRQREAARAGARRAGRRAGGNRGRCMSGPREAREDDGTVSPWRGTTPELLIAAAGVLAVAVAGYAMAGWAGLSVVAVGTAATAMAVLRVLLPQATPDQARKAREKATARTLSGYSHRRFVVQTSSSSLGFYQSELRPVLEHLLAARLAERHGVQPVPGPRGRPQAAVPQLP